MEKSPDLREVMLHLYAALSGEDPSFSTGTFRRQSRFEALEQIRMSGGQATAS
jgi:hypothetical protein